MKLTRLSKKGITERLNSREGLTVARVVFLPANKHTDAMGINPSNRG
jgi:hypothetical protein